MLNKDTKALRKSFYPSEMETVNFRLLSQDPTQLDVAGNGFEWWTVSGRHPHTDKLAVFSSGYFLRLYSCFSALATANL